MQKGWKVIIKYYQKYPIQKEIDATHADINIRSYSLKKYCPRVGRCHKVGIKRGCQYDRKSCRKQFWYLYERALWHKSPINDARQLCKGPFFYPHDILLNLIPDVDRRENVSIVLDKFNILRNIYRINNPQKEFPNELPCFKLIAVKMGQLLLSKFEYPMAKLPP